MAICITVPGPASCTWGLYLIYYLPYFLQQTLLNGFSAERCRKHSGNITYSRSRSECVFVGFLILQLDSFL